MSNYSLLREDLDNLLEVCQWPNCSDPMKNIESKVKAAFTRSYNKDVILPYATNLGSISKRYPEARFFLNEG
jgi:replication factor C subunit 1